LNFKNPFASWVNSLQLRSIAALQDDKEKAKKPQNKSLEDSKNSPVVLWIFQDFSSRKSLKIGDLQMIWIAWGMQGKDSHQTSPLILLPNPTRNFILIKNLENH
jgi:hypothetical protein